MNTSASRIPVAVLGATGAVGQAFVRMLEGHPWFELVEVAASDRSKGKRYRDAVKWHEGVLSERVGNLEVLPCEAGAVGAPIVFSALDSSVAGDVEGSFAVAGRIVLSNAKNFRMSPDVPLVIPEVNGSHLRMLTHQRDVRGWAGGIVTNANCAATVIALALAPLHEQFRIQRLFVTTMQAVSGAGYPGVPSLDILGNVIPYIADEEEKIESELQKLLGGFAGKQYEASKFAVSAHANRVAVEHGHTACISVSFEQRPTVEQAAELLRSWRGYPPVVDLPSAPKPPLVLRNELDRPQARRDVMTGNGMAVTVGRLRSDSIFDLRMVAMGHNVVRGAAGGSVLNAELLVATGQLEELLSR